MGFTNGEATWYECLNCGREFCTEDVYEEELQCPSCASTCIDKIEEEMNYY